MEFEIPNTGTGLLGAFIAVVIAAAFWLRKLKPDLAVGDKVAAIANADTGIIQRLEKECNRMAEQNTLLAEKVNEFQRSLLNLTTENTKLHAEVCAMREENADLRKEIRELKDTLAKRPECADCERLISLRAYQ